MDASIAICTINLFIPDAHTLKEKRYTVKSIIDKIRAKTNCSVAETDFHDLWQRAQITIALVAHEKTILQKQIELIRRLIDNYSEAETTDFIVEYI